MSDDWKGLDKIKAKTLTGRARVSANLSIASSMAHKRRAAFGVNMSRAGGAWAVSFAKWHLRGKIEGGKV